MAVRVPRGLARVIAQFAIEGEVTYVAPWPGGHINTSYRVEIRHHAATTTFLLQRLNPLVFPQPEQVMDNVARVSRHLVHRLRALGIRDWQRRALSLVPTRDGRSWLRDHDGAYWRFMPFVTGTLVKYWAESSRDALEAARAFGGFLRLLADYDGPPLHHTLPGFHDTAARFARLDDVVRRDPFARARGATRELAALDQARPDATVLPSQIASGAIPTRIAHNDAKLANVLLDAATGTALCVIDLDTVMPGSALYDFGDLVRSLVSPTDEDEPDLARIAVRPALFEALARGYLETAGTALTGAERRHLVFAGRLITLEQAVRFLTDHLENDRYFRVTRPRQNLDRARTQLRLYELLKQRQSELEAIAEVVGADLGL